MVALYGIPNCDTMKKARAWLDAHGVDYRFHDYKREGVDETRLRAGVDELGWETLVNRRGTTWRKLDEVLKAGVVDAASARALMLAHPGLIRRPVIERDGSVLAVGFDAGARDSLAGKP